MKTDEICWIHAASLSIDAISGVTLPERHSDCIRTNTRILINRCFHCSCLTYNAHYVIVFDAKLFGSLWIHFHPGVPHDRCSGVGKFLQPGFISTCFTQSWRYKWQEEKFTFTGKFCCRKLNTLAKGACCIRRGEIGSSFPPAAMLLEIGRKRVDLRRRKGTILL